MSKLQTEEYSYGIDLIMKIIGGKWKKNIIFSLGLQPMRYGQLLRFIHQYTSKTKPLSKKVLTQQLNNLIAIKIVSKKSYNSNPPKTVYSLTLEGQELNRLALQLSLFGEDFAKQLETEDFSIKFEHQTRPLLDWNKSDKDKMKQSS